MEEVFLDATKSARTQEAILNYVLTQIRYKDEVRRTLLDALLFKHGILWHGYKGDFGRTEEDSMFIKNDNVFVKRLNPLRFLKDPAVHMNDLEEVSDMIKQKGIDSAKGIVKEGFQKQDERNLTNMAPKDFVH